MTEPSVTAPVKRRRRRFVLSLRVLMLLVLVVGGWLGWRARRASVQRAAVAEIRATGGTVWYDFMWQAPDKVVPGASPWAPLWLRRAIGDEYFQEPRTVFIERNKVPGGRQATAATFAAVASLDRVEDLNSYQVPLTDADLARLATMPRLREFCLLDTALTDEGLAAAELFPSLEVFRIRVKPPGKLTATALENLARQPRLTQIELVNIDLPDPAMLGPLAKLPRLERLRLWRSPTDDACLVHLRDLTTLKSLDFRDTKLTDAGVDHLDRLDRLETILIDGSKLTDAGLSKLAARPALKEIYLEPSPNITDASLVLLGRCQTITLLRLIDAKVSDAGLTHLRGLKLDSFFVSGPGVTDRGLADLAASHQFTFLELAGTSITGEGLAVLNGQAKLQGLGFDRSPVDDAAVAALTSLPILSRLSLAETRLTDTGLLALVQGAPRLQSVNVTGSKVTARGVAVARKIKPGLRIDAGFD